MPNFMEHERIAGLSGAGAAAYEARQQELPVMLAEIFGGYMGGKIGGRVPDLIDPPTSPNHRSIGHGVIPNGTLFVKTFEFATDLRRNIRQWAAEAKARSERSEDPVEAIIQFGLYMLLHFVAGMIAGMPAGHISHLLADSMTKKGLPLIA